MRVLVTGANGMLARALVPELERLGNAVCALPRQALDVTDFTAVRERLAEARPDVVVQCAAYTAVDDAERHEDAAFLLNAEATANLAECCQRRGALLVYPSTDYVFSGASRRPYRPDDPTAPVNAYGRSKAAGEAAARSCDRALIIRTSWLYGAGGRNFVDTIRRSATQMRTIRVVDDQVGLPTWSGSLAAVVARLLMRKAVGTFHASDRGNAVSWFGFAREILDFGREEVELVPISSADFGAVAPRPRYSVLDCSGTEQVLGERMPSRSASLARYLLSVNAG